MALSLHIVAHRLEKEHILQLAVFVTDGQSVYPSRVERGSIEFLNHGKRIGHRLTFAAIHGTNQSEPLVSGASNTAGAFRALVYHVQSEQDALSYRVQVMIAETGQELFSSGDLLPLAESATLRVVEHVSQPETRTKA